MLSILSWRTLAAFGSSTLLATACRSTYLPTATLGHPAPECGTAPIQRRTGDATPTYFACQTDRPVVPPSRTALRYPSILASANVEGTVDLQFVVDQRGAVDRTTIVVLRSTHDLFTAAARESLTGWGAQPARRRGGAVRQLTTQGFCFQLVRPTTTTTPSCALERRNPQVSVVRACENFAEGPRMCVHGGCAPVGPPEPRPLSRCP